MNAWRLVLNALNALPAVTGTSAAYQAAILACENRSVALELFFEVPKVDDSGGGVWNHGQVVGE